MATCPDIAPIECSQQVIPDHRHVVRLTLYHSELTAGYGLSATILLLARLPYDVKDQRVRYTTLDGQPFARPTATFITALRRYGDSQTGG